MQDHRRVSLATLLFVLCVTQTALSQTERLIESGTQRLERAQQAQENVDAIYEDTQQLLSDYQSRLQIVDGLESYVRLLDEQLRSQDQEINTLQKSIADATVVERQVIPLLERMLDGLERFLQVDAPFLTKERQERLHRLRRMLVRSDVSAAEKCRRVFEAYEIENDYGRTIESYKARIELTGDSYDAEFLRVGRIALMFRLIGQTQFGFWNEVEGMWQVSDDKALERAIANGIAMANKDVSPRLIQVPVTLEEGVAQ